MATNYDQGNIVRCSATFTAGGVTVDPGTVKFVCISQNLAVTLRYTYGSDSQLVKDQTGAYHVDVDTTTDNGTYTYRFYSTGTNQGSASGSFYVMPDSLV